MARYKVLERSFINNRMVDEGAEIEFEGEAGANLELIEEEPKRGRAKPAADTE